MSTLLHADLTFYLRGVGFKIRNELGGSHPEAIYEDALAWQLEADGVPFMRQASYEVHYKGRRIGLYRPDIMVENGAVGLELKVAPNIEPVHKAQGISYLAVTKAELLLLMNFGASSMQFERLPNFLEKRIHRVGEFSPSRDFLYPEITKTILDGLYEIHYTLGPGFLHKLYAQAALYELSQRALRIVHTRKLPIRYQGQILGETPTNLLLIENKILLATVGLPRLTHRLSERLRWAMRELNCPLGIVANFYPSKLDVRFYRR